VKDSPVTGRELSAEQSSALGKSSVGVVGGGKRNDRPTKRGRAAAEKIDDGHVLCARSPKDHASFFFFFFSNPFTCTSGFSTFSTPRSTSFTIYSIFEMRSICDHLNAVQLPWPVPSLRGARKRWFRVWLCVSHTRRRWGAECGSRVLWCKQGNRLRGCARSGAPL
jgi:hypothetical protein